MGSTTRDLELDESDRAALVETIRIETARLERMVRDLLDLSRLEAGAADPQRELWPVDELVGAALDELAPTRAACRSTSRPICRRSRSTRRRSRAMLVNVLENAHRHAVPPATSASRRLPGRRDGRPSRRRRRAGYRPARSSSRVRAVLARRAAGGSTGLGLAIARGFAEENGARSGPRRPRRGAALVLTLPTRRPPDRPGVTAPRILVVDDEPQILRALRTNLRGAGYEVDTAATAEEALAEAAMRQPDAVILDLAAAGRERNRRLPRAADVERRADDRALRCR